MRPSFFALAVGALLAFPAAAPAQQQADPLPADTTAVGERALVKAGDQLALRIAREPDLSGTFTVRQDGAALLPRLGDVRVVDLTAGALQDTLRRRYAEYLRQPELEVAVLRRVAVSGEVRKPDLYLVDLTMTLRDVIARAGGITEAGNPARIEVIRDGRPLELGRDRTAQFKTAELRSGDQVVVGRRSWWALNPTVAVSTVTGLVTFVIGIYQLAHR